MDEKRQAVNYFVLSTPHYEKKTFLPGCSERGGGIVSAFVLHTVGMECRDCKGREEN